jgi:hypothetical protein
MATDRDPPRDLAGWLVALAGEARATGDPLDAAVADWLQALAEGEPRPGDRQQEPADDE